MELASNIKAKVLRELYVFKIFVGLNPDGVVAGNARAGAEGADLAQVWWNPDPELHPTVFQALRIVRNSAARRGIVLFCEFRSHHVRRGTFMYGPMDPPSESCSFSAWTRVHLVPWVLGPMLNSGCIFDVSPSKVHGSRHA